MWDNDGEFLLIEAAYSLPKGLKPENAEHRVREGVDVFCCGVGKGGGGGGQETRMRLVEMGKEGPRDAPGRGFLACGLCGRHRTPLHGFPWRHWNCDALSSALHQVWLHDGKVHVIPLKLAPAAGPTLSLQEGLGLVEDPGVATEAPAAVARTLSARLSAWPQQSRDQRQLTHVLLPSRAAELLEQAPQVLPCAVEAFHYRDLDDAKVRAAWGPVRAGLPAFFRRRPARQSYARVPGRRADCSPHPSPDAP